VKIDIYGYCKKRIAHVTTDNAVTKL